MILTNWLGQPSYKESWHPWWAWRPVNIGNKQLAWFQWVQRRGWYWSDDMASGAGWSYEYLPISGGLAPSNLDRVRAFRGFLWSMFKLSGIVLAFVIFAIVLPNP